MALSPLRKLRSELIAANPYWEYWLDAYQLADGSEHPYHYVHTRGSVMIIPIAADGRFVLVRQYRYLWQRESLEFPGGGIAEGFLPHEQAQRELAEEAGFRAEQLELIGEFNPMNGVTTERCSVFVARGLVATPKADDPAEETEVEFYHPEQLRDAIARGDIWDGMTLAAWALYQARQKP